ncbi:Alpha/Beta hydrolase protein [Mycena rebaudengoi]|nr:Alpha/Beta hydrolase protein [Mycena rebaudengoi]
MDYPDSLIVPPLSPPHLQTFIILHGRGSSSDKFGSVLLETPVTQQDASQADKPQLATLAACFPHARFVFPTAARRRATVYRRALTRQWFDNWKLDPPATDREELQIPGLCETTIYLHDLLRTEIAAVPGGASNVVLGGLSQGCAASLVSLLLWEGEPLAAWFGMCGWLPFAASLTEMCVADGKGGEGESVKDGDVFNPFERESESEDEHEEPADAAISWLKEELQIPQGFTSKEAPKSKETPLLLGHGVEDDKVSVVLGRSAHRCVSELGYDARWRQYESLGHWYSGEMLRDLAAFLHEKTFE